MNQNSYYISEEHDKKFGVWYCDSNNQWYIGLTKEKGKCKGYAYINGSLSCLCGTSFGWRLLKKDFQGFDYWQSIKKGTLSIKCNNKGKRRR